LESDPVQDLNIDYQVLVTSHCRQSISEKSVMLAILLELRTRGKWFRIQLATGFEKGIQYWRASRLLQFSREEWYKAKPIHLLSIQKEAISYL